MTEGFVYAVGYVYEAFAGASIVAGSATAAYVAAIGTALYYVASAVDAPSFASPQGDRR